MSDAIQRIREALAWSARAFGDHSDDIRALLDRLDAAEREIERLRHDIERHIAIASEYATECERLRAELAECKEMLDEASGYVREDVRRMGDEWSGYIIDAAIDSAVALLDRIDAARKGEGAE